MGKAWLACLRLLGNQQQYLLAVEVTFNLYMLGWRGPGRTRAITSVLQMGYRVSVPGPPSVSLPP